MALRVLLADDHKLVLEAVQHALEKADDFQVVATTHSGAAVPDLVARHRPDIVVMDLRMPEVDGLQALDRIRARDKKVKVVILSASDSPNEIQSALARGADGFILKSVNPVDLPSALRQVHEGTVFHGGMAAAVPATSPAEEAGLTEREVTLVRALARGLSNKQISQELWITEQTVKFHLSNIYRKLDVSNRTGAVRWAHEHGLGADEAAD
ncbi:MAG TPA: response regulator transcription factor [Solirubrobacteraceae bacterium]|jgi:DNA-binding NarL/FixJ family response regulator|nr:response regulator transcription factor [Solirubrobacteraceae bacterium]